MKIEINIEYSKHVNMCRKYYDKYSRMYFYQK